MKKLLAALMFVPFAVMATEVLHDMDNSSDFETRSNDHVNYLLFVQNAAGVPSASDVCGAMGDPAIQSQRILVICDGGPDAQTNACAKPSAIRWAGVLAARERLDSPNAPGGVTFRVVIEDDSTIRPCVQFDDNPNNLVPVSVREVTAGQIPHFGP